MGLVTEPIDLRLLEQVWPTPHLPWLEALADAVDSEEQPTKPPGTVVPEHRGVIH